MKKLIFTFLMFLSFAICNGQKIVEWVCTIENNAWENIQKQTVFESTKQNKEGSERTDMFIQDDRCLKTYSLSFSEIIKEYRGDRINIFAVTPQYEFAPAMVFPNCCRIATDPTNSIGSYLALQMNKAGVDIYFGTKEHKTEALTGIVD